MKQLKKIIYAEDEKDIQTIVQMVIDSISNYEIKFCDNGVELLEQYEEYAPDLIMLDVMMPELDGISTFNELKKLDKAKDIPVILITAKAQTHEVEEYLQQGLIGVITKPFDPMTICDTIQNIWEKHQTGE